MDPWILSDGTKVYLGGKVEGDSFTAKRVRDELSAAKREPVNSCYGPPPHCPRLDVDAPHLLDAFLRVLARVKSAPEFEKPSAEPRPVLPDGAVY